MKKKIFTFFVFCLLVAVKIFGQSYRIVDVNASAFPEMEARILAYDANYNPDSLKADRVSIYENTQKLEILEFKAPQSSILPTSIVILLDISASMEGIRFEVLKKTAKEFIQHLPLEISEVAIASFSDDITLNCDFTHNIQSLNESVDGLYTSGGTNYNRAFLTPFTGVVNVANKGKFKRVVIFFTDGLSDVKHVEVANKAIHDSIFINCITIGLPISDELKYISKETGGNYYSELIYEHQIKTAFDRIYLDVQSNTYGKIRWKSEFSCTVDKTTTLNLYNQKFTISYKIPDSLIGSIAVSPTSLIFDAGVPGKTQYKPVFVKGNNMGLNTTSITNTNKLLFGIKQQEFPIKSELNELKMIEFSFTPKDSIYETTIYTVKNPGCPDAFIEAATRGERKLLITNPIKGNEFVRGAIIPISWKGIEKSTSVDFFYRIKGQNLWHAIGAGTQNQKLWKAPALNDSIRIQGRVTNNITLSNLLSSYIQLVDGEDYKAAYFSPDGTQIITHSNLGQVKNWNAETGVLNHIFEKSHFGDVAFFPNYNRLVSIFDSTFSVFTNRNGLEMVSLPLGGKKVYASLTHVHNKELYASLWNYSSLTQMQFNYADEEYKNGTASPQGNFAISYDKSVLTIYKLQAVKKWFTIKVNTDFEKAILHNSKDYMVIVTATNTVLYNLELKQIVKQFNSEYFVQFTVSGTHFITESNAQLHVNELKTGNRVYSLPAKLDYAFSKNGKYLAYLNNDTLCVVNLANQQIEWRKPYKKPEQFQFFPESNRLVLLHKDTLTILNYKTRQEELNVYAETNLIKMLDIAPNEKSILLTTQKIVALWEIKNHFDTDTTPYFNIFTPQPEVASQISFSKQYLNVSTEKVFKGIIKNHTLYPVGIDSMYISSNDSGFSLVSSQGYMNILPYEEKAVEIRFTPHKIGIHTGNLIVVVGNTKYTCKISGEGISRTFDLPNPFLHYPPILVGTELDSLIPILINSGTESILVKDVDLKPVTDNNFKLELINLPKSLHANDTLWANVVFNPKRRGMQNAFISLKLDDNEWIKATNVIGAGEAKRQIILAGKTLHAKTGENLESLLTLTELNSGNIIFNEKTLSNGFFAIKVNTDLNYSISAQLIGFFSSSINIDLLQPQFSDTLWVNIDLIPLEKNGTVKLNNIFFEFGKAELLDISKTEIMRLIALMEEQPALKIEIRGHTDNIGSIESNMQLSKMRAIAVKTYMLEAHIDSRRITTTYYGETQALQDNNTELGRKANRRVEIKFIGL